MEVILWIILVIIVFRLIARFIMPYILKYFLKRFQQNIYQQPYDTETNHKQEGETVIDHIPEKKEADTNNIGEYVDYEEIK